MKTCVKCGELNGDGAAVCFKCGRAFSPSTRISRICPKCQVVYPDGEETCRNCGGHTGIYDGSPAKRRSVNTKSFFAAYLLAFFVPIAGLILAHYMAGSADYETADAADRVRTLSIIMCFGLPLLALLFGFFVMLLS